jgi:nitric oxide dioxygenase
MRLSSYWRLAWLCMNREEQLYNAAGWVGFKNFTLVDRVQEADDIVSFYMKPQDKSILTGSYKPGQYISVQQWVPQGKCYQQRQWAIFLFSTLYTNF